MLCCNCPYTDGLLYLTDPPKVKCVITEEFHYKDFECNCECARLARANTMEDTAADTSVSVSVSVDNAEPINWDDAYSTVATIAPVYSFATCLVCRESFPVSVFESPTKICEDCKKAILFIKERFKGEYDDKRENYCDY